jgi:predicted ATPase
VKLLLTSREQVHLQWEWIFEVQGLPIPDGKTASSLQNNSAATLFLNRARQIIPDLLLTDQEAIALVHICSYVDGLPLAIELAASWVRVMSFQEIALELKQNLNLLTTSMQDVPPRHRSMEVVFDHSWTLLTVEERTLITRLAAFPGGFTRKAAETVADASLVLLSSLVSKSLLRYYKNADHYDFHELIRQYASKQLHAQPEEEQRLRMKHSQYYAGWVADLEKYLKGPQQMEISRRILSETANWSFAWHWAANHQRLDMLRQMLTCLAWYFEIHGYYDDALSFIQSAVNKLQAAGMPGALTTPFEKSAFASLTNQLGWVIFRMGNLVEAVTLYESSLGLAQETGDQETLFYIHNNWAYLAL